MKKTHLYILAYFFLFSTIFVFLIPPFEANDEPYHLEYINYIVKNSSLPNQLKENERVNIEGHQFPLYYMVSASLIKIIWGDSPVNFSLVYNKKHFSAGGPENLVPVFNHTNSNSLADNKSKSQFYFLRLLSVVFGMVNLFFVFKIVRLFFADEKIIVLCLFFAASLPQFIYVSSTITNDSLANLLSTLAVYTFLILLKDSTFKKIISFCIIFPLCLICKKTLFFLIPSVLISSAFALYTGKINKNIFFKLSACMFLFTMWIAGWFYLRNYFIYNDVLLNTIEQLTVPMHYDPKSILSLYFLYPFVPGLFGSFFGVFGWMNVAMPFIVYLFYFIVVLTSILGIIKKKFSYEITPPAIFVILSIFICFAGIVYYNLSYTQHQGRFLFPVLSLISVCLITGLKNISVTNKINFIRALYAILIIINIVSVYVIYRFYYIENNYL